MERMEERAKAGKQTIEAGGLVWLCPRRASAEATVAGSQFFNVLQEADRRDKGGSVEKARSDLLS